MFTTKRRKGFIPIFVWVIVTVAGSVSLFGRGILDTVSYGFCKLPIVNGWSMCNPTLADYITYLMPWAFVFFCAGLGYLYLTKGR